MVTRQSQRGTAFGVAHDFCRRALHEAARGRDSRAQVRGKRGGPANSGWRAWTAVGASLSQAASEAGMADSVTG